MLLMNTKVATQAHRYTCSQALADAHTHTHTYTDTYVGISA